MAGTLVLDLDGTLVDTAHDLIGTLNHILADKGFAPLTMAAGRSTVGHGARVMIERAHRLAGAEVSEEETDRLMKAFVTEYGTRLADESRPFPGAVAAIDRFAAAGWRIAICTNKFEALALQLMQELGLADRFDAICGQDTFAWRKPDARALTGTIARAGGDPGSAVMVGDSDTDVATARNAGVPVVAVSFGYTQIPAADLGADVLIDHFDELWDAVAALERASG